MADETDLHVGKRLRRRRRLLGMTQQELASQVGVRFQQIQKYESGSNRIASSKLMLAAEALQCVVTELVGERRGEIPGTACLIRA